MNSAVRLQKLIAASGFCSRRKAEELIQGGAVSVNGHVAKIGDSATEKDNITVNGKRLERANSKHTYVKYYKPRGVACTLSDPHETRTLAADITKISDKYHTRLLPVGRLDKNSEGLIFLTDDGEFINHLTHPKFQTDKRYRVTVRGKVTEEQAAKLCSGVEIEIDDKGTKYTTAPCEVNEILHERGDDDKGGIKKERTVLEFILSEGKNRQIRKMCEKVGLEVARLKRTAEGGVKLGMLEPGRYEPLTKDELKLLGVAVK
jgi:23S rRNA pseudouridine2605 synthase